VEASNQPGSGDEVLARLRDIMPVLPKRLQQCGAYVAAHPDRIALSTVSEMAEAAGVQPSAFMRFCQELGFSGYTQMQRVFRNDLGTKWPDYTTRLEKLRERGADSPSGLLAEFVDAGRHSLEMLTRSVDHVALEHAVSRISGARTVHVAGFRRAFAIASYMAYAFEKLGVPTLLHAQIAGLDAAHALRAGDALVVISFAPYTPQVIALAERAAAEGVDLVIITDTVVSPLARFNGALLLVNEIEVGAFRSLSASTALAMTLAIAVGARRGQPIQKK
jgi:DNA-binding MurR/RpiR family transcriptional regulator